MDLFDLGEGFSSLSEGVARIQCPTLVSIAMCTHITNSKCNKDPGADSFKHALEQHLCDCRLIHYHKYSTT